MLHRLRAVLVRPERERLAGMVQMDETMDETYLGGVEPDLPGGRAQGKKGQTGVAVEVREPKGMGRCRMAPLADASAVSLHQFVSDHVEPGATVVTEGWQGYRGLDKLGYSHLRHSQRAARFRGEDPGKLLPAAHQVISLAKRWLLGTHHGAADDAHSASYLNEFVFRFNRRRSRSRGMLFFRVLDDPVRYHDLIASRRPRKVPPTPPLVRGRPAGLARPPGEPPVENGVENGVGILRLNGCPRTGLCISARAPSIPAGRLTRRVCRRTLACDESMMFFVVRPTGP